MYKLVLLFKKREDLTFEQFLDHWKNVHVPLVLKVPNIRRYIISPIRSAPIGVPEYDGMAELWFDDEVTARAALETPETMATGRDGHNFLARGSVRRFFTEETVIVSESA